MRYSNNRSVIRYERKLKDSADGDAELQWLEDGVNYLLVLTFQLFAQTCLLLLSATTRFIGVVRDSVKNRPE